jgi:hypothetical protein
MTMPASILLRAADVIEWASLLQRGVVLLAHLGSRRLKAHVTPKPTSRTRM